MPVTHSRNGVHDMLSLDQTNTTRFLFGDDEAPSSSGMKNYLNMNPDHEFPTLVRRDEYPGLVGLSSGLSKIITDRSMQLSASSAALDLALSQSPGPDSSGWPAFARHRPSQPSLPMNSPHQQANGQDNGQGNGHQSTPSANSTSSKVESPMSVRPYRHSLDMKFFAEKQENAPVTSPSQHPQATPPKLQSSHSANDVPTIKAASSNVSAASTPKSHAQQHFHNHNASLGRIPPNAVNNRHSREMSGDSAAGAAREAQGNGYQSIQSALHANAPAFGPPMSHAAAARSPTATTANNASQSQSQYPMSGYYGNYGDYGMQMMTMGMQNMQMGNPMGNQVYSPHNPYANGNYGNMYQQNGRIDSQARVIQQRRQTDGEREYSNTVQFLPP